MKKEIKDILMSHRDILLREGKQERQEEYKKGFVDGVLDMFNKAISTIEDHVIEQT